MSLRALVLIGVLTLGGGVPRLPAQEAADGAAAKTKHTVKKGALKIEVALIGVFEARQMTPINLRPEAWAVFTVLDSVEHGSRVQPGDTLVTLDLEGIDTAIADLESGQKLAELSLETAKSELAATEAALPLDLEAAERGKRMADEDLKRFLELTRPQSEKSALFALKSAEQFVEYQQEELNQLEKMYKADDLTEETEEIILKRARNDLEQAKFFLEQSKEHMEQTLQVELPRLEISMKESALRHEIDLGKTKTALSVSPGKLRLALERQLHEFRQAADRLVKLKKDREAMLVKAPVAGVVYYGHCQRGKWSSSLMGESKFTHGSALTANSVFMTIVQERPMCVRTTVAEKELRLVRPDVAGKAVSVAFPNLHLPVKVEAIATVPTAEGNFDAKLSVDLGGDAQSLLPGMNCNLTLVAYSKPDAVTVPPAAVFSDQLDDSKQFVYRVGADGNHQRASVTIGQRTDTQVEILDGLLEGDKVLLENPEAK